MQAVIMAAGRGTRLGPLTTKSPKSLILVGGRPILEHILLALTPLSEEIIIVVGYLGEKIRERFGPSFGGIPLTYIEQKRLAGTADALWQARDHLKPEKFLAVNGDDFYNTADLERCLAAKWAMGLTRSFPLGANYEVIGLDQNGLIANWRKVRPTEMSQRVLMVSGAYVLDRRIFDFSPVAIGGGEYGLPQTIFALSKTYPVRGVVMKRWASLNRPEDIATIENLLV